MDNAGQSGMSWAELELLTAVNRVVLIGATPEAVAKLEQAVKPAADETRPVWCGLHAAAWEFLLTLRQALGPCGIKEALNCLEQSLRAYFLELPDRDALPQATPGRMRAQPYRRTWERLYGLMG